MKDKNFKYSRLSKASDDEVLDYYLQLNYDRVEFIRLNDRDGLDHVHVMLRLVSEDLKKRGLLNATINRAKS